LQLTCLIVLHEQKILYRFFDQFILRLNNSSSTITITKLAKMTFIEDPRYSHDDEKKYEKRRRMKEDVSMTHRAPYPQEHEIGLPRMKLN